MTAETGAALVTITHDLSVAALADAPVTGSDWPAGSSTAAHGPRSGRRLGAVTGTDGRGATA